MLKNEKSDAMCPKGYEDLAKAARSVPAGHAVSDFPFFSIIKKNGLARVGVIHTPHGDIKTPAFVGAATRATVKALTMKEMRDLGSQAILANTYHLILAPGSDLIKEAGGLAEFSSWHGPTFTDSGGFQIFSLPDVKITENGAKFKSHINGDKFEMTPESSMQAQWAIGADIHMAFDHLAKSESYDGMKLAMERTHRWLDRCVDEHKKLLAGSRNTSFEGHPQLLRGRSDEPREDGRDERASDKESFAVIASPSATCFARVPIISSAS